MEQKRILRVVIASPRDVQAERDTLPAVVDELNRGIAAERNLLLELLRWETDAYPGFHPEGPQGLIDPILNIEDCDILIGLFWKRFGTPTKDAQSGTEHEILSAYRAWQQNRRPQIMVYFNQKAYTPKLTDEIDQWGRVLDFKQRLPKEGLWWEYKGKAQFERLVRNHLTQFIRHQYPLRPPALSSVGTEQSSAGWERQDVPCRSTDDLTKEYLADLTGRVSTIYIFGEEEPRALEKVFVELSVVEEYRQPTLHAEFLGLMDAEMRQRRSVFARGEDKYTLDGPGDAGSKVKHIIKSDELLLERTKAVVTGAPGCGKTTLLHYLTWRTHEAGERLPVFLELKTVTEDAFSRAGHDLAELLFAEAMAGPLKLHGAERECLRESFMARLAAGKAAIFLDGLDEVSGTNFFPRLRESVVEFVRRAHRDNTLVISTRPYALPTRLEGFKEMEIAPLNQHQIEEFFVHYYGVEPESQRLLRTLWQRRPLRELMRVPFLLAMVAQLYRREQRIVEDRLGLYQQIVLRLVIQLDCEKLTVYRDFRISDRGGKLKLGFLKYLACERLLVDDVRVEEGSEAARLVFTGDMILDKAQQFWESTGRPAYNYYDLADDVKATPLLREIGTDVYAFTHLTIQEYLAAVKLAQRTDCREVFCQAYFNSTLAEMEVLPMTLGLARHPEKLYTALEELPESLTFNSLRLRARGLAYVTNLDRQFLSRLSDRLLEFVNECNSEETPYREIIIRSFSEARAQYLEFTVEFLVALVKNGNEEVRRRVLFTLREIGSGRAVDALSPLLNDEDSDVRLHAASMLGEVGGERAVDVLLPLLNDENSRVRLSAVSALGEIGSERAVNALLPLLKDKNKNMRWRTEAALGHIGSERALDALPKHKPSSMFRRVRRIRARVRSKPYSNNASQFVASLLEEVGGERAVDVLLPLLRDKDSSVRESAASALGEIGGDRAVDALLPLLNDAYNVHMSVVSALGRIGSDRAVEALLLMKGKDGSIGWHVVLALGRTGNERAVEALLPLLKDKDFITQWAAARALSEMYGSVLAVGLMRALTHENKFVRRKATQVVGYYAEGEDTLRELTRLAAEDSSEEVRIAASEARERYERKLAYFL